MTIQIVRLLEGDDTLYAVPPRDIAQQIEEKLNNLLSQGLAVDSVSALADHHHYGRDGGVKDIIFFCRDEAQEHLRWKTALVIPSDQTMYGWLTEEIVLHLEKSVRELEVRGGTVAHIVPLQDHHQLATLSGTGGYDGVKNIIICYYEHVQTK